MWDFSLSPSHISLRIILLWIIPRFKRGRKHQKTHSFPTLAPVLVHSVEMPVVTATVCMCCHGVRTSLVGLSQGEWKKAQPLARANCLCRGGKHGKTAFNSAKSFRRGRKPPDVLGGKEFAAVIRKPHQKKNIFPANPIQNSQ